MQVFAIVGESLQQVGGECPEGWVVMREQRPDVGSIALADGTWGPGVLPVVWPRFVGNQKLDLFTLEEQLEVVTATQADPVVKLFYDRLLGALYWSYEDPETERGLALLVEKGLLMPTRRAEIVAAMQPQ